MYRIAFLSDIPELRFEETVDELYGKWAEIVEDKIKLKERYLLVRPTPLGNYIIETLF
jgi:hypothetical protein